MVKPICSRAAEGGLQRWLALFDVAGDVLDHDDRVVDDKSGGDGQSHQGEIVEAEAEQVHRAEGADQRQRNRQARDQGRARAAQEYEDHQHHQYDRQRQLIFNVLHRGPDGHGPVGQDVEVDGGRQRGLQLRQQRLDALHHRNHVGARLPLHVENDRRGFVHPGAELVVLGAIHDIADIAEPDRRTVLVGDDQRFVIARIPDLVVGVDGVGAHRAVEIALRRVDIGIAKRGAQVVDVEPVGRELADIGADAHCRPLAAADADKPDTGKLGDLLREAGVDEVLHLCQRHRLRRQSQGQDWRVGRVHLGVDRRRGQVGGQQVAGSIDRGLHFLLGDIERNGETELQRDHRRAGGTHRAHLVEVRHLAELHLQRCGDRGGHHIRAGAGIEGLHLDGRIVHFRQSGDRQEFEREHAGQHDCDHQQGGRHRPQNERLRRVHCFCPLSERRFLLPDLVRAGGRVPAAAACRYRPPPAR